MSNQTSSMPAERTSIFAGTAETREAIRAAHQVRLIERADEGKAAHKLPNGVFGFTFAPLTETPLFAKHSHQSFEVHKLPNGELRLVGYVSPANETRLYPDAWGDAVKLVSVRVAALAPADGRLHREPGNPVALRYS